MKKKVICITGASGFIGTALTKYLSKDYDIIGIDRRPPPDELMKFKNYTHYLKDINHLMISDLPKAKNPYAVIHLAANPGVRDSHENFEAVCRDNILGTQRIIDKCISTWKPKKILLASSSSVYGDLGKDGHALEESDGVSPRSPYAMSKVAGEALVETYKNCGMLDGIETASMRFFTVYGENQRLGLAIRAFTDAILRDEPITLYGTGEQIRDFTSIDDICSGIKALLEEEILHWDIYNIGSGNSISINQIIQRIGTYLDKSVTINYQPRNRYDVDATRADITNICDDTCWEPKTDFDDGLKKQILWQKEQYESVKFGMELKDAAEKLSKTMKGKK